MDTEERARRAAQLLDDEFLVAVLDQVRTEAIDAWIGTRADDVQAREMAWMLVKAQGRIRDVLQGAVDNGTIAARRATAPLR